MKVAIVCPRTPRIYVSGIEEIVKALTKELSLEGIEAEIFTTSPQPIKGLLNGAKLNEFNAFAPQESFYFSLPLFFALRKSNTQIIHCNGYNNLTTLFGILAKKKNQKLILMLNSAGSSSFFRKLLYPLFDLIINIFKNRIDKIIASSNTELNEFKKRIRLPSEKFSLIRLGVDLEQIKEIQVKPKKNQIISVGRLVKNKGFHHLIDAIKIVKNKKPNIKLIIVGKGPFEEKLKKQVIKHGLHENVLFIGSIPFNERKKLIKLIKESSLFVLLSDYEGAPISVLLAVACKTPILLNNKGVLAEHVKEFKAIGCNSRNHEEVAEKIISILNKPEDFIPESHKIQDIKESCKKIIELYKELNSLNQTNIKY